MFTASLLCGKLCGKFRGELRGKLCGELLASHVASRSGKHRANRFAVTTALWADGGVHRPTGHGTDRFAFGGRFWNRIVDE